MWFQYKTYYIRFLLLYKHEEFEETVIIVLA